MNKDYNTDVRYVDIVPAIPILPSNTSSVPSFWPTPHPDARVDRAAEVQFGKTSNTRSNHPSTQSRAQRSIRLEHQPHVNISQASPTTDVPTTFPPVELSKQLSSTPCIRQPSPVANTGLPEGLFTPPDSVDRSQSRPKGLNLYNMDDPNRSRTQRHTMGPPETPSRFMQASPNMFPSLQFSPDMYSTQSMAPMTAPAYPQQRLFWDPSAATPQSAVSDQYYNPYQDALDASFAQNVVEPTGFTPMLPQDGNFDVPLQQQGPSPFLDTPGYPAPFQTSPRMPTVANDNPAQFLSSPARRFGGVEGTRAVPPRRPAREIPAYHHQIQESKREMELERDRRRNKVAKRADEELIMKSVRRALSPSKSSRPGLRRSVTHSGIGANGFHLRHQNRVSFNDTTSISSKDSNTSTRNGRSSPLKRTSSTAGLTRSGSFQKPRTSVSLAIDENGVAKTVLADLAESDGDNEDETGDSESSASVASSTDLNDTHVLQSHPNSFAFMNNDDFLRSSQSLLKPTVAQMVHDRLGQESAKRMNRLSLGSFSERPGRRDPQDTIRPIRKGQPAGSSGVKGDAQKALRAIIQDRSRSTSTQGDYPSSRQSDTSVQFHSSPPIQQNQFGMLNVSPTTITDPDLATPSTDQESYAMGEMRCICNSTSPDQSGVVQCESCSKWLHAACIGIDQHRVPESFVCVYCEQTPMRHPANRSSLRTSHRGNPQPTSPLAHKSARVNRNR